MAAVQHHKGKVTTAYSRNAIILHLSKPHTSVNLMDRHKRRNKKSYENACKTLTMKAVILRVMFYIKDGNSCAVLLTVPCCVINSPLRSIKLRFIS